ncbi:MAG: hypothetical protein HYT68_02320 [Candidatus Zambryskibacteria bacterium]|nr:hypothetical protein [Candidatus Zambryskibacteria bacterium]
MKEVLKGVLVFAVGAAVIVLTAWAVNQFKKPDVIEKIIEKPVFKKSLQCAPSQDAYRSVVEQGQSILLVDSLNTYAIAGRFVNDKNLIITRSGSDEIACGYLYIKARKDSRPLETQYESVYINPQDFGGHILGAKSIEISKTSQVTEFLIPLNTISYLSDLPYNSNSQNFRVSNWVNLLNVSNEVKFHIGLSANDSRGVLEEVRIAYRCWNPNTGEETQNCQLGVK